MPWELASSIRLCWCFKWIQRRWITVIAVRFFLRSPISILIFTHAGLHCIVLQEILGSCHSENICQVCPVLPAGWWKVSWWVVQPYAEDRASCSDFGFSPKTSSFLAHLMSLLPRAYFSIVITCKYSFKNIQELNILDFHMLRGVWTVKYSPIPVSSFLITQK